MVAVLGFILFYPYTGYNVFCLFLLFLMIFYQDKEWMKKFRPLFIIMMLYVSLVISLLCASYNLFNLKAFDISQTLLFNVILLPFVLLLSIYYGSNYNKAKKVYDITSGLFVGILIVLLLITTSALLYKVFKIKKIAFFGSFCKEM